MISAHIWNKNSHLTLTALLHYRVYKVRTSASRYVLTDIWWTKTAADSVLVQSWPGHYRHSY